MLTASPSTIHFRGNETSADLRLGAKGGPVSWTAMGSSPQITLSSGRGRMPDGGHATIHVVLRRGLLTLPGTTTVTVTDDTDHSLVITVSWDLSVL